jgi:hypothetical protein
MVETLNRNSAKVKMTGHAPRFLARFEHVHLMAIPQSLVGHRKPHWTSTYHDNFCQRHLLGLSDVTTTGVRPKLIQQSFASLVLRKPKGFVFCLRIDRRFRTFQCDGFNISVRPKNHQRYLTRSCQKWLNKGGSSDFHDNSGCS